MMDREVALEALGVLCNAEVTSVQTSVVGLQAAAISGRSAPSSMTINHLVSRVLDGDEFRPVPEDTFGGILRPLASMTLSGDTVDGKGILQLLVDEDEFFDPKFDFDFTKITDRKTFYRGGEKYKRPCGWKRFALKVLGKYDDDTWLGNNSRTTESAVGEWPVPYHGTSQKGAEGIIEGHYEAGDRAKYGRGVYSTPYVSVAKRYATKFWSKKKGKWYKVLLQNRINPEYRKIYHHGRYWLVRIPKGMSDEEEKELVERAIRPYGLLLKEIKPPKSK